ncbi:MAG: glycerophosphodiester phosphodiesterase family protein, partial [Flavobacteriales bacterium]
MDRTFHIVYCAVRISIALLLAICDLSAWAQHSLDEIIARGDNKVLVAAHRGDWRNFPENSIPAVWSCIERGIDIVEVDVQETRDGKFVLMHDATVSRTTNGKGKVSSYSYERIRKLKLKDASGNLTDYTVPGLDTILTLCKGRIIVNLDKSAGRFQKLLRVIDSLDCGSSVILKGEGPADYFQKLYSKDTTGTCFMPIFSSQNTSVDTFATTVRPPVMELLLRSDTCRYVLPIGLNAFRLAGTRLWYNALFSSISGGHDESKNPMESWQWFIDHDAFIIQSDYPFHLQTYLVNAGLHAAPEGYVQMSLDELKALATVDTTKAVSDKKSGANTTASNKPTKPKDKSKSKNVTVKKGDSLSVIASRNSKSLKTLLKLNPHL